MNAPYPKLMLRVTVVALSCVACSLGTASPGSMPAEVAGSGGTAGGAGEAVNMGGSLGVAGSLGSLDVPCLRHEDLGATCDPARKVGADGAFLVEQAPETLSRFGIARVLSQIVNSAKVSMPPEQVLQRLFDTENVAAEAAFPEVTHCDQVIAAVGAVPAVECPRVEGRLAKSVGLLTPGDPDNFFPVAVVSRFDLMPSDHATCGEYRIVYAKQSGLSDPKNRAFLIFEAALLNPDRSLKSCRPVAEFLAGLEALSDPAVRAAELEQFYFVGLPGFGPVVDVGNYGARGGSCSYGGQCGQVRVSQGMQAPWVFRQFRLSAASNLEKASLLVEPVCAGGALLPSWFDAPPPERTGIPVENLLVSELENLGARDVGLIRFKNTGDFEARESGIEGAARPDYLSRMQQDPSRVLEAALANALAQFDSSACPEDDPLTPASVVERATALSCAGCHAPQQLLSPERKLGCGAVWPNSLGQAHIDEHGARSEALTSVFLPHRADVLSTYLQACDEQAIVGNLMPVPPRIIAECFPAGTPIDMVDGSSKPIERIGAGEWVLSYDLATHALVPSQVSKRVLRPHAQRFVTINGSLRATDNHPFFSNGSWVRADALAPGVPLLSPADLDSAQRLTTDIAPTAVQTVSYVSLDEPTYNLDLVTHENYFAGGYLVYARP